MGRSTHIASTVTFSAPLSYSRVVDMGRLTHMLTTLGRRRCSITAMCVGVLLSACAIESPVSVTDRPLAEKLDDMRDGATTNVDDSFETTTDAAPDALAFNDALAAGDFVRLNVTSEGVPAILRSGPGQFYEPLSEVPSGAEVLATGNKTGEWLHIVYADFEGWITNRRVTLDTTAGSESVVDANDVDRSPVSYVVIGEAIGVNMRAEPDAASELVSGAPVGSVVTGSGNTEGAWVEVTYQGVTGWASGNYLELADANGLAANPSPDTTATPTTTTVAETQNTDE